MGAILGRTTKANILVLGLDNSGKTSVVTSLKPFSHVDTGLVPNVGINVDKIRSHSVDMTVCDVSGKYRGLWEQYYKESDGIIFVIDSSDQLRLPVAREELSLALGHNNLRPPVPILILANKMDMPDSLDCAHCRMTLDMTSIDQGRRWQIFSTNALTGEGLPEAISWFTDEVKEALKCCK